MVRAPAIARAGRQRARRLESVAREVERSEGRDPRRRGRPGPRARAMARIRDADRTPETRVLEDVSNEEAFASSVLVVHTPIERPIGFTGRRGRRAPARTRRAPPRGASAPRDRSVAGDEAAHRDERLRPGVVRRSDTALADIIARVVPLLDLDYFVQDDRVVICTPGEAGTRWRDWWK